MGDVVSIFKSKEEKKDEPVVEQKTEEPTYTFEEIMKKNNEKRERESKERLQTNRSVLRTYRIKN